jgi:ABC-type transporter Mla MlaB component
MTLAESLAGRPVSARGPELTIVAGPSDASGRDVFWLSGELDLATAPVLASSLDRVASGRTEVVLHLGGLEFCDVIGLTALETAQRRLAGRGCALRLRDAGTLGLLRRFSHLQF